MTRTDELTFHVPIMQYNKHTIFLQEMFYNLLELKKNRDLFIFATLYNKKAAQIKNVTS